MTDVPALLTQIMQNPDIRFALHETLVAALLEEKENDPETVPVTVTFHIHKEDWARHQAANPAHLTQNQHEMMVEVIQDCLYDGGPLEYGDFEVT